jgi:D-alanyl-D-alanine carboxypeptidase (penicillin-binding protein 5/6)
MNRGITFKMKSWIAVAVVALSASFALAQESYIIIDNQTGVVLEGKNKNTKLPVASLTKIATAIVAMDWAHLQNVNLSTVVEVSQAAFSNATTSSVGLQAGDMVSLRDLIYCALLASDNGAAYTLANYVGSKIPNPNQLGPEQNFVAHMNALARKLGMKRTLFLNSSGMDNMDAGTVPHSTAEDMARLTRHAYHDAGFKFYVSQKSRVIHVSRFGADNSIEITNTNELIGKNDIDGVKTGRTRRAGDCLIVSAERPPESRRDGETVMITPRRITVVLLRSQNRFAEGLSLINRGWALYDTWAADGRPAKKSNTL